MSMVMGLIGLLCAMGLALVMGFAIQRGGTCTVAAVDALINQRQSQRFLGLIEASLWVGGGLMIANALGWVGTLPAGHRLGWQTVAGAVLLGAGAFFNRACVFGAVARLSNGEWAYLATPLGFYIGCWGFTQVVSEGAPPMQPAGSIVLQAPAWAAALVAGAMGWRVIRGMVAARLSGGGDSRVRRVHQALWAPGPATVVIGVAFLFLLLIGGAWAYTDVLAQWARNMKESDLSRAALFAALLVGAGWGGLTAGRFQWAGTSPGQWLRCLSGGALMGWGSQWIPGGNDGLILLGMPLLWPYAWVAFLCMCTSIALLICLQRWAFGGAHPTAT